MDFPATLPRPTRAGYAIAPLPRTGRTRFDAGNVRRRPSSAAAPFVIDVRWLFTGAQMAVFEAWFAADIAHGADDFNIDLANGLGLNTVAASFEGMYQPSLRGGLRWEVRAQLRVATLPILTAAELEVAGAYAPADLIAGSPTLHTLIHTTLPGYW